jgi:hypothetical protein
MTSFKILAALALFSATASAPVFSATLHRQARHNYVSSRVNRDRSTSQSGYGHYNSRCYFPEEWPKLPPWPPFCN